MNNEQLQHAAEVLLNSHWLISPKDELRYLPKVFIVNGKCYWFLNAAKRAAFGTKHVIRVMTIEQAWRIWLHLPESSIKQECIEKNFDQTGDTFGGRLFDEPHSPLAQMVNIPIVPIE